MTQTAMLPGLSIVLPCLDEAATVAEAVRRARAAGSRVSGRVEVIVVDDGSTDGTARIAGALADTHADVRLVVHPSNRGYGAALRTGIAAARMPWVLLTDADLQFDLGELEELVALAGSADVLVGYRIDRRDPPLRRLLGRAWSTLVRTLFRLPVRDVDCAFKLAPRRLLAALGLEADGAVLSAELLVKAARSGATIREVGVHHLPRPAGRQSGASPRVVARALRELLALRLHPGPARTSIPAA